MDHRDTEAQRDSLTEKIIGAAIEVHRTIGPGLLESAYEACLAHELKAYGLSFRRQVEVPVRYKGLELDCGYRIDLLVENSVVIELKSVESLLAIHEAQLLTYMKLLGTETGLLINFNVSVLKNGVRRMKL